MSQLSINGIPIQAKQIVPLKAELQKADGIGEASRATRKNGIDEIYFQQDGTKFVAYGTGLDVPRLKKGQVPTTVFNGRPATFVTAENEANALGERVAAGAKSGAKVLGSMGAVGAAIPAGIYLKAMTYASTKGSLLTMAAAAGAIGLAGAAVGALTGAGVGLLPLGRRDWKSIEAVTGQTP